MNSAFLCIPILLLAKSAISAPPDTGMSVTREDDYLLPGQSDWVLAQSYASLRNDDLLRALTRGNTCVLIRSIDGGRTWSEPELVAENEPAGEGRVRVTAISVIYLDPGNGLLVRFLSEVLCSTGGGFAYADSEGFGPRTGRILYQISRDGGVAWEAAQQLIESGARYNSRHWARDVWYGRSALGIEGQQVQRLSDGALVIPAFGWPTDRRIAEVFEAQAWPEELRLDAKYHMESRCLVLRWKPDLSGLTMTTTAPIVLQGGYTPAGTCGSDEPAVAYLDDRRWFVVLRTSTSHRDTFEQRGIELVRQSAYTDDGGKTWTAESLRFDDGDIVHSPSAWSQFIRSTNTGRWYWIGNILPEPTYGNCDPRYPLSIAELDGKTLRLKRATVTTIQDREPGDDACVRFSNFRVYEERGTRDIIVHMRKGYCELAQPGLPTPAWRYRISVGK